MATFQEVAEFLESNHDELVLDLSENERPQFETVLGRLKRDWAALPDDDAKLDITLKEMRKYPTVWQELAKAGLVPNNLSASPVVAPHTTTVTEEEAAHALTREPRKRPPSHTETSTHDDATNGSSGDEKKVTKESKRQLSQEVADRIAISKELITGIMGTIIILVTLIMVVSTIFTVSNTETHAALKDALLFMNGLVGVVLGYYFGRVPGDTRANQAENQSRAAVRERDRVVTTVRTVLNAGSRSARERGSDDVSLSREQVEDLRRVLRQYDE